MHDEATPGLKYNNQRYLHTGIDRWITRDPLNQYKATGGYQDGMNLYLYVGGNPVVAVDPMGTKRAIRHVWTHDLWEDDFWYDDHLANFKLDVQVRCVPCDSRQAGDDCWKPDVENIWSTERKVGSAGGGYGHLDEVKTDRLDVLDRMNSHGTRFKYVIWEGHGDEGDLTWAPAAGGAVGAVVGGLVGAACSGGTAAIIGGGVGGGIGTAIGQWLGSGYGGSFRHDIVYYCTKDGHVKQNNGVWYSYHGDDELFFK